MLGKVQVKLIYNQFTRYIRAHHVNYCNKAINKKKLYSNTVLLPKTKFPLRLDKKQIAERDSRINNVNILTITLQEYFFCTFCRVQLFSRYTTGNESTVTVPNLYCTMVHLMQTVLLTWDMQLIK